VKQGWHLGIGDQPSFSRDRILRPMQAAPAKSAASSRPGPFEGRDRVVRAKADHRYVDSSADNPRVCQRKAEMPRTATFCSSGSTIRGGQETGDNSAKTTKSAAKTANTIPASEAPDSHPGILLLIRLPEKFLPLMASASR